MSSSSGRWHRFGLDVLAEDRAVVEADGREILLLRVGERVHALANACPHEGNPLVDGDVLGDRIRCAYHGWTFDLASGACLVGDTPARRYPVEVDAATVRIRVDEEG